MKDSIDHTMEIAIGAVAVGVVIIVGALTLLPRAAHPQSTRLPSGKLLAACSRSVGKLCHAQAKDAPTFIEYRKLMGQCVKVNFAALPVKCRELIEAEFSKELRQ